jgi:hypothetical protein
LGDGNAVWVFLAAGVFLITVFLVAVFLVAGVFLPAGVALGFVVRFAFGGA